MNSTRHFDRGPVVSERTGTLKLNRSRDTLVLEWRAGPAGAWSGFAAFFLILILVATVQGGLTWVFALLFGFLMFARSGPQMWLRKLITTFDLSSRQVHRFTGFILGGRSERYSFGDI